MSTFLEGYGSGQQPAPIENREDVERAESGRTIRNRAGRSFFPCHITIKNRMRGGKGGGGELHEAFERHRNREPSSRAGVVHLNLHRLLHADNKYG